MSDSFDLAAWRIEQAARERVLTRQTWAIFVSAFGIKGLSHA